tara:strand:+ start:497 stop:2281 length:1785 start_codon:yes stop_codon:yes gene_type:complete
MVDKLKKLKKYIIFFIIGILLYYIVNTLCNCNSGFNIGAEGTQFGQLQKTVGSSMKEAKAKKADNRYFKIEDNMIFIYKDEDYSIETDSSRISICHISNLADELKYSKLWKSWYFKFYYAEREKYYYIWLNIPKEQTDSPIHDIYKSIKSIRSTCLEDFEFLGIFTWVGPVLSSDYYVYLSKDKGGDRIGFYEDDPKSTTKAREYDYIYKQNIVAVNIYSTGPYLETATLDKIIKNNNMSGDKIELYFKNLSGSVEYTEFYINSRESLDTHISQLNDLLGVGWALGLTTKYFKYYITIELETSGGTRGRRLLETNNVDWAFMWLKLAPVGPFDPQRPVLGVEVTLDARLDKLQDAVEELSFEEWKEVIREIPPAAYTEPRGPPPPLDEGPKEEQMADVEGAAAEAAVLAWGADLETVLMKKLEETFQKHDADNDGKINREELGKIMEEMGYNVSHQAEIRAREAEIAGIDARLSALDEEEAELLRRAGDLGRIRAREAEIAAEREALLQQRAGAAAQLQAAKEAVEEDLDSMMTELDRDRSGSLNFEDFIFAASKPRGREDAWFPWSRRIGAGKVWAPTGEIEWEELRAALADD